MIPADLRQKLNIKQGTQVHVFERNGEIILRPLTDEFINSYVGMTGNATTPHLHLGWQPGGGIFDAYANPYPIVRNLC